MEGIGQTDSQTELVGLMLRDCKYSAVDLKILALLLQLMHNELSFTPQVGWRLLKCVTGRLACNTQYQ